MARKTKLRDLSRLPPEYDDLIALNKELIRPQQHPITRAIVGAVMVEHKLDELLQCRLKHKDADTWEMLTADNGPLNSFSAKIAMGYALGIYDQATFKDLNIVRNIRNAFAHSKTLIDFDHPAIIVELKKATRSAIPKGMWKAKGSDAFLYGSLCLHSSSKLVQIYSRTVKRRKHIPTVSEIVATLQGSSSLEAHAEVSRGQD